MRTLSFQRLRSVSLIAPAAVLLVAGLTTPAHAIVTISGNYIAGDAANDYMDVTCLGGVLSAGGDTGDPCAGMTNLNVVPGAGADTVTLGGVTAASFPALVTATVDVEEATGAEVDNVFGSPGADILTGDHLDVLNAGDGNDVINGGGSVSGGLGDDTIHDFMGSSTPTGGPGDDRFVQFLTLGGVEGGPGLDSYELDFDRLSPAIGTDLTLRLSADTLRVIALPTDATLPFGGIESVELTLLRGDTQTWDGTTFAGMQRVRGMAGVDTVTGGAADDALHGGGGNDVVTGNGGVDLLHGGDGDDVINARDGVADRVDCGAGTDSVVADAVDVVMGCESVSLPPVAAPPDPPVVAPPVAVVPVTGAIAGPGKVSKPRKAKFTFASSTAGATFECRVDKKAWKSCRSPYKVATKKLDPGKHKLLVRAVVGGVADASPSKKVFKVRTG